MVTFPDFSGYTLANSRYTLLNVLGSGTYGTVYKALDASSTDKPFVAIKCLAQQEPGSRLERYQHREFALHKKLSSHPNIITFHDKIQEGHFIFVVLDLCDGGDLYETIQKGHFLNRTDNVKAAMVQLIDALQYCHKNSVFHRDLKPDNVLMDNKGQVYLADFGLCTDKRISTNFGCGTSVYLSPEAIVKETGAHRFSTLHSDIWALGVILVNVITGCHPWSQAVTSDAGFNAYIQDRDYLCQVLPISHSANQILRNIFEMNPLVRPSLSKLREQIMAVDTFFAAQEVRGISSIESFSTPSTTTSLGPITPESKAIHIAIEVSDMPEGQDIGEIRLVCDKFNKLALPRLPELDLELHQILRY